MSYPCAPSWTPVEAPGGGAGCLCQAGQGETEVHPGPGIRDPLPNMGLEAQGQLCKAMPGKVRTDSVSTRSCKSCCWFWGRGRGFGDMRHGHVLVYLHTSTYWFLCVHHTQPPQRPLQLLDVLLNPWRLVIRAAKASPVKVCAPACGLQLDGLQPPSVRRSRTCAHAQPYMRTRSYLVDRRFVHDEPGGY